MGNPSSELTSYCKIVFSKGVHAICYLTDNTQKEQETIFAFLDQYGLDMDRKKLMETIKFEKIEHIVVGLPLYPSGDPCEMTPIVENFIKMINPLFDGVFRP